jgi:hypothetical protein
MIDFNTCTVIDADELSKSALTSGTFLRGVIPRQTLYGSPEAMGVPLGDVADVLIDLGDAKEIIAECHEHKLFPMYHQDATWAPDGFQWNQNGLGYCWTWSGTGDVMNCQAREGKRKAGDELLAPVSMGYLVGWRNRGNYLEDFLRGARDHGIAPASCVPSQHSRDVRNYASDWEEKAFLNRIADNGVWDCNRSDMLRHSLSHLRLGVSGHIAYNWWSHALSLIGVIWDESQPENVRWVIRNSHNETKPIIMTGRRGTPDECFGVHATATPLTTAT